MEGQGQWERRGCHRGSDKNVLCSSGHLEPLLHLGSRIHGYSATGDPKRPSTGLREHSLRPVCRDRKAISHLLTENIF